MDVSRHVFSYHFLEVHYSQPIDARQRVSRRVKRMGMMRTKEGVQDCHACVACVACERRMMRCPAIMLCMMAYHFLRLEVGRALIAVTRARQHGVLTMRRRGWRYVVGRRHMSTARVWIAHGVDGMRGVCEAGVILPSHGGCRMHRPMCARRLVTHQRGVAPGVLALRRPGMTHRAMWRRFVRGGVKVRRLGSRRLGCMRGLRGGGAEQAGTQGECHDGGPQERLEQRGLRKSTAPCVRHLQWTQNFLGWQERARL